MKKILTAILSVLLCLSAVGLVACNSAPADPPPKTPEQYTAENMQSAFTISDTQFSYQLSVNGGTTIVVVDNEDVSKKLGTQTTTIFKKDNKFYTYALHEEWKTTTEPNLDTGYNGNGDRISWDKDYYEAREIAENGETQRNEIRDLYKTYLPLVNDSFSAFKYDTEKEKLVASQITIGTTTYHDVGVKLTADGKLEKVDYVLDPENANPTIVLLSFSYYYQPIAKPEYVVSFYGDVDLLDQTANKDAFKLVRDNFSCFYQDISSQQNILYERAGDLIKVTEYNVKVIKKITYYEKIDSTYNKYVSTNGVDFVKENSSSTEYEEQVNKIYNLVIRYNEYYNYNATKFPFSGWQTTGGTQHYYIVTAGNNQGLLQIYLANEKVEKILVRGFGTSNAYKKFYYEFSFNYGNVSLTLPTIAE